jgi:Histidine kinase-, DNA gyrase B-, and HSP90-like ATPase
VPNRGADTSVRATNNAERAVQSTEPTTLHYTARAGLLSELSRQTYDSLYKALREAILNGIDAGARQINLDFGEGSDSDELVLEDDGEGMDLASLRGAFMSLGGSAKYNDSRKFGRIGIGSLALLTYGTEAMIETKRAGATAVVEASLFHPQSLDRQQRAQPLHDFPAGLVTERKYEADFADHFTRIRLTGLTPEVRAINADPAAFYDLLDQMRRVLPLPLSNSRLLDSLEAQHPALVELLKSHAEEWSVPVTVSSAFQSKTELKRRTYGDGDGETWSGALQPVEKRLRLTMHGERREITVAGFLASQKRAVHSWSGLTARVQNVAVEEQTFFGVDADPGFRKYITGEIFVLGEVDTDRLININRTSFNRESKDFSIISRYVATELEHFKRRQIAHGQRQKVILRRKVESYRNLLSAVSEVAAKAGEVLTEFDAHTLPSSKNGSLSRSEIVDPISSFRELGAKVVLTDAGMPASGYKLERPENEDAVHLHLAAVLASPAVAVAGVSYTLAFRLGPHSGPPVIIKNRPREIVFNLGHPAVGDEYDGSRAAIALALELAYVLPRSDDADGLYDRLLRFLAEM